MSTEYAAVVSLDDIDQYKRTMRQFIRCHAPDADVTWRFKNRTRSVRLADTVSIERLKESLDQTRLTARSAASSDYCRGQTAGPDGPRLFADDFVEAESGYALPEVNVEERGGDLVIEVVGPWSETSPWETIVLSTVNELHYRGLAKRHGYDMFAVENEGRRRLEEKISLVRGLPDLSVLEFGTRRRLSRRWQEIVLGRLLEALPGRVQTSNIALARKFGLDAKGTMAHELFMVFAAVGANAGDAELAASQSRVLDLWYAMYGEPLSLALSDTFGSGAFFRDFAGERARLWRGVRHDSGDPFAFGEAVIGFYEAQGIDPLTKTLVFSDGLTPETIVRLHERFHGRIRLVYGWGTNLTNDVGLAPLSMVMKVARAAGRSTVKLSDNPAKAMGDSDEVERYRRVFRYSPGQFVPTVY